MSETRKPDQHPRHRHGVKPLRLGGTLLRRAPVTAAGSWTCVPRDRRGRGEAPIRAGQQSARCATCNSLPTAGESLRRIGPRSSTRPAANARADVRSGMSEPTAAPDAGRLFGLMCKLLPGCRGRTSSETPGRRRKASPAGVDGGECCAPCSRRTGPACHERVTAIRGSSWALSG